MVVGGEWRSVITITQIASCCAFWLPAVTSCGLHTSSCWSRKLFSLDNIIFGACSSPWAVLELKEPWKHVTYGRLFLLFLALLTFTVAWSWKKAVMNVLVNDRIRWAADAELENFKMSRATLRVTSSFLKPGVFWSRGKFSFGPFIRFLSDYIGMFSHTTHTLV